MTHNVSVKRTGTGSHLAKMIMAALFAALTAVGAWLSFPLPFTQVPISLASMIPLLAAGLLGWKYGTISTVVYLLLGVVGAPVFHNFTGGVGILAGPTGGYLIGYVTMALLTGWLIDVMCEPSSRGGVATSSNATAGKRLTWWAIVIACVVGTISCYVLGTAWFMITSGTGLTAALVMCVIPFLPGDAAKIAVATILIRKLRPRVYKG